MKSPLLPRQYKKSGEKKTGKFEERVQQYMESKELISDIMNNLNNSKEHILVRHRTEKYFTDFFEMMENLSGFIDTQKKRAKLRNNLCLNPNFNESKYYQGISEVLFWIYLRSKEISFSTDVRVNLENNFDIDIQVEDEIMLNIEIKCPDITKRRNEGNLEIVIPFRTISKEQFESQKNEFDNIADEIVANSKGRYDGFSYKKIDDNKMLEYLKSAQCKFKYSTEQTINVLAVSVPTNEIELYWGYLYNGYTGLFTESSYAQRSLFDKVDVVYLTNLMEGHMYPSKDYNSWDIKEYLNILCVNPFSNKERPSNAYDKLYYMLPNDNNRFDTYFEDLERESKEKGVPLLPIVFDGFIEAHYSKFLRKL